MSLIWNYQENTVIKTEDNEEFVESMNLTQYQSLEAALLEEQDIICDQARNARRAKLQSLQDELDRMLAENETASELEKLDVIMIFLNKNISIEASLLFFFFFFLSHYLFFFFCLSLHCNLLAT